ncbi:UNVERIFIED_CONTAM: hypothetical protein PYX00_001966 [Menopon gallinae]|uniref:Purple acid phosphatase n=1 Tax=Menopon gallinae TaxID=328185 RepID=A0AAW2IG79_9NEOP
MMYLFGLFCLLFAGVSCKIDHFQPEQVHLSFGNNLTEMFVTWTTYSQTSSSIVEYGIDGLILKKTGESVKFVDGGVEKRTIYIHKVKLTHLTPNSTYLYHCGSNEGWSSLFSFHTPPDDINWSPRIALFGDMGSFNAQSLSRLQQEAQRGLYDVIIHIGDFAYDMDTDEGRVGDEFMRQIESIAAYVPYMTVPGNHEEKYNFSHYRARFTMPGDNEGLYYSFNFGPIHFIGISSEVYYYLNYGLKQMVKQYDWLQNDLKEATYPENRADRPWIITLGHRPMYCSNDDSDDCTFEKDILRVGLPILNWFGLEDLFYEKGVDMEIWAHEHSYERTWPLYNNEVYNGSFDAPYTNPGAPVHIITGSAGCNEFVDKFINNPKPWSAFRSSDYGYTRLTAFNKTHLYLEQVSDDKEGAVIDWFWLIKTRTT